MHSSSSPTPQQMNVLESATLADLAQLVSKGVESRYIPEAVRTELILLAIKHNLPEHLAKLAAPVSKGGFGWSMLVTDREGNTPIKVAVKHKLRDMVLKLVLPINEGGYGLSIDEASLRILEEDTYHCTSEANHSAYHRQQLSRIPSCIELSETDGSEDEKYFPIAELSKETHCHVRLFAKKGSPKQRVVVKSARQSEKKIDNGWSVLLEAEIKSREAAFVNLLYPGEGPNLVAHYVDAATRSYDSRTILRYVEGEHPCALAPLLANETECAFMIMAISLELQRIHGHRVVHRDVRSGNIVVKKMKDSVQSADDFKVHFIDMENTVIAGDKVSHYLVKDKPIQYLAPETMDQPLSDLVADYPQDIYGLGFVLQEINPILDLRLTSISDFIEGALNANPDLRPKLNDFINNLRRDIEEITQTSNKRRNIAGN